MYNKLFTKILDSSIWLEPTTTRIVWITLLAAMDEDGYAHFSALENLASRARVTIEEATKAIECFLAPDPNSGNPANDGRRVERVPGGYLILNGPAHRAEMSRVVQREQTRQRVAKHRALKSGSVTSLLPNVTSVYASAYEEEGTGEKPPNAPTEQQLYEWVEKVRNQGADYTKEEARMEWLALNSNRWMWGRNPVTDWRSAIEKKIQDTRKIDWDRKQQIKNRRPYGERKGGNHL